MPHWLNQLSIGLKLVLGPALSLILMACLAGSALYGLHQQQASLRALYEVRLPHIQAASDTERELAAVHAGTYGVLSQASAGFPAERLQEAGVRLRRRLDSAIAGLARIRAEGQAEAAEAEAIAAVEAGFRNYRKALGETIDLAASDAAMATTFMIKAESEFVGLGKHTRALRETEEKAGEAAYRQAETAYRLGQGLMIGVFVLSLLLSVGIALLIRRNIVGAVAAIGQVAEHLTRGDLSQRVHLPGRDEIAVSAQALNRFIDSLSEALGTVLEGVNRLAAASEQLTGASHSVA